MKSDIVTTDGYKQVTKMYKSSGVVREEINEPQETIMVRQFEVEPARAHCFLSMTTNLGNYESLKIECGVNLPCYIEELAEAQLTAFNIAKAELFKRINEVKANL